MIDIGTIEIDGFTLQYRIEGSGPTALVIGSATYYARSFSQELRQHLRLVFIDWRGLSQPPGPKNISLLLFETFLDDIEHVRQKLGIKKCIVIGHSAHALLALEYVKKYSQHISCVAMIGTSPNFSPEHAAMAERNWQESVWPERKAALEERIKQLPDDELAKLSPAQRFVQWYVRKDPQAWYDFQFDSSWLWEDILPNMSLLDYFYGVALRDLDVTKGLETFDKRRCCINHPADDL